MIHCQFKKQFEEQLIDVNFRFDIGVTALLGPSGVGKSTVLKVIAGLVSPDEGQITLGDQKLFSSSETVNLKPQERHIGFVFQDYALFPHMTAYENLIFGMPKDSRHEHVYSAEEMFKLFHLEQTRDKLPAQLSGGQQQRIAMARALMSQPRALLLDEPFSALDQQTKSRVQEEFHLIKERWRIPIILVTHDEREAELLSDTIIRMSL